MEIDMAASDFWNAFKSGASNLATAYDNKVKEKQRETYLKRLALDRKYGTNLAEGMYQGDYNLRKLIKDVSPIGAAMNVGSALEEGDYKKAGLNVGLLGLEALPVGKALSKVGAPLANRVLRDKDMLIPALTDKDYTKLLINETLMGKAPLAGKAAGSAPLSEAEQVNQLIANNADKFNAKDLYEFSRNKFRQKYINEWDNDPSMQFMSLMHSSKRPDLTLDNYNFGSTKTANFSDALKHKAIAPDLVFNKGYEGLFAKQVKDADEFLTDPHYRDFSNRYIVTSGFKKPPLSGGMDLEIKAGAPRSQKMGLRQYDKEGNIIFTPSTKNEMYEYFVPARAIRETGGIDKVYSLENVTDYLRSLK
tara:strand:+ start:1429 stop:2517 length:1089 start_codon:yes stop_codon:yes gene_type:complete